jgi:excisionase family DNA binding protein
MEAIEVPAPTVIAREIVSTTADPLPALMTVSKAAALLGISRASAYRYAAAGELPTRRFGGRMYVVTARLLAILDGAA